MPMLLVNREVGTQMWPSIQLSDDLGGVIEHASVAWPGYPGCRHDPGSPQTSCLLSASPASRWDLGGRNFGRQQAWRCDGRPLCSWACSQSPSLGRCAEPQDTWPWLFSLLMWMSLILSDPTASFAVRVLARVPTGWTPHLFMWSLSQHCLQTRGSLATRRQQECLLHIILLYSEMAFNFQIFTLQVAGRLKSVSCNEGPMTSRPSPVAFVNRLLDFYVSLGLGITF